MALTKPSRFDSLTTGVQQVAQVNGIQPTRFHGDLHAHVLVDS